MLEQYVRPGMKVLEVGAARCWGARHFSSRGCEYTGSDILTDGSMGIGRGRFYCDRFGYFERVQADGEYLPFRSRTFDLTYAVAALHHAMNVKAMIREMARVTRRRGLVIALNEGVRPFRGGNEQALQSHEIAFGINEHVHTASEYVRHFLTSGLMVTQADRASDEGEHIGRRRPILGALARAPFGSVPSTIFGTGVATRCCDGVSIYSRKMV
jgi:ubiquinone/menaquinone biosynthesis C-methylase UbiE